MLRTDKVCCVIPTLLNLASNEDLTLKQGLKYMETLKMKKSIVQTSESVRTDSKVNECRDKNKK